MQTNIVGWDIGGAHLKLVLMSKNGVILAVQQCPCELWKGLDRLEQAVVEMLALLPATDCSHILTMTGELVDLFADRNEGVKQILYTMQGILANSRVLVYAGRAGIMKFDEVRPENYPYIASANWLASASWVAEKLKNGLFVDIGSTTTDVLLLDEGKVCPQGYTDHERLISRELVYTGIIRTPVMAVAHCARDKEDEIGLMAEYFATMADVYRVTGELSESHDQASTADGAEKTLSASAKRLARMIGSDFAESELPRWINFAHDLKMRQLQLIRNACERHLPRGLPVDNRPIIGAGVGRFLVQHLARDLHMPYVDFSDLFLIELDQAGMTPADCAPAASVAYLAAQLDCA